MMEGYSGDAPSVETESTHRFYIAQWLMKMV